MALGLKRWAGLAGLVLCGAAAAQAAQPVQVTSLDAALRLPGHWFAVPATVPVLSSPYHTASARQTTVNTIEKR